PLSTPLAPLVLRAPEVVGDHGALLIRGRARLPLGQDVDAALVAALRERDLQSSRYQPLLHVAPARAARTDAGEIDGAVADVVIAVAAEVLRGELPVAGDDPLLDAAEYLGATLAPVPAIEGEVEVDLEVSEVFEKGGRGGVPRGPDRFLVDAELGHFHETVLRAIQL